MALVVNATPTDPTANSFITVAEADEYFTRRLPLATPWEDADDPALLVVMATNVITRMFRGIKRFVKDDPPYYLTGPKWTGLPATTTQRLPWPRIGMYDLNGNAIAPDVFPPDLKDATAEMAGQLLLGDPTLNNDVIVQGIRAVRAGSVGVDFKDSIQRQVIPDAVLNLLVPSWYTDEMYEMAQSADFDVVS